MTENKNELLSIVFDSNFCFEDHIKEHLKKQVKNSTHKKIAPYMPLKKRKIVMKAFITSQYVYCLFAWIFHGRGMLK